MRISFNQQFKQSGYMLATQRCQELLALQDSQKTETPHIRIPSAFPSQFHDG